MDKGFQREEEGQRHGVSGIVRLVGQSHCCGLMTQTTRTTAIDHLYYSGLRPLRQLLLPHNGKPRRQVLVITRLQVPPAGQDASDPR